MPDLRAPITRPSVRLAEREVEIATLTDPRLCETITAEPGQRVVALPAIDGLDRYQNPHLGRNLNHFDSHRARLSPPESGAVVPVQ